MDSSHFEANNMEIYDELVIENISIPTPQNVMDLDEYNLERMSPTIAQLVRSDLTEEEIKNIGQAVVYVETRFLQGYSAPLLEIGEYESSLYDYETNTIYISKDRNVKDYKDYIKRIVHLCYHSYQFQQIETLQQLNKCGKEYTKLYMFLNACQWEKEIGLYSGCKKECQSLYLEKDATTYENASYQEYLDAIDAYWGIFKNKQEEIEKVAIEEKKNAKFEIRNV